MGKEFRRKFRVPFPTFEMIVTDKWSLFVFTFHLSFPFNCSWNVVALYFSCLGVMAHFPVSWCLNFWFFVFLWKFTYLIFL
jgi:hypothetical protein